jgi:undecaprenyl-diphosphatase
MKFLKLVFVQGLTEAFPISSSAHIAFFLGIRSIDQGIDALLHLGSLLSLCAYFYQDVGSMLKGFLHVIQSKKSSARHLFNVIIATTVPCCVTGFVLHILSARPHGSCITAFSLCFFGIVLYGVDRYQQQKKDLSLYTIPINHALVIGFVQTLSLIPGVSRLGICIIAGRLLGYSMASAARTSFVMGIPVMACASLLHIPQIVHHHISWSHFIDVTFVTMVINLPMIYVFLQWTCRYSIAPIALYRIGFGLLIFYQKCLC